MSIAMKSLLIGSMLCGFLAVYVASDVLECYYCNMESVSVDCTKPDKKTCTDDTYSCGKNIYQNGTITKGCVRDEANKKRKADGCAGVLVSGVKTETGTGKSCICSTSLCNGASTKVVFGGTITALMTFVNYIAQQ